jgi:hypothetical protein
LRKRGKAPFFFKEGGWGMISKTTEGEKENTNKKTPPRREEFLSVLSTEVLSKYRRYITY